MIFDGIDQSTMNTLEKRIAEDQLNNNIQDPETNNNNKNNNNDNNKHDYEKGTFTINEMLEKNVNPTIQPLPSALGEEEAIKNKVKCVDCMSDLQVI